MTATRRLPEWFKVPMPGGPNYMSLRDQFRSEELHTVCEEARCPNIGDCWERGTATFMILGDICTRACAYCAVTTGVPQGLDLQEPIRLAETVERLGLKYVVITSVNRDDLPDGGSFIFAQCVRQIRSRAPDCKVELLIPDFDGNWDALASTMEAGPDTLNHNIETVRRVFRRVRPKGDYDQSLELLRRVKRISPDAVTKSGMMVGLGETWEEIVETMRDLRSADCDLLTRAVSAAFPEARARNQVVHAQPSSTNCDWRARRSDSGTWLRGRWSEVRTTPTNSMRRPPEGGLRSRLSELRSGSSRRRAAFWAAGLP